ncbi:MAG TPA: hypothetical protein VD886_17160, partial [Herpetosiphonaceae bacterium]|nr:hypothetical protein [Herpetosiphonaceae bacterium]
RLFRQALPLIEATGTRDRLAYLLIPGGQTLALRGQPDEANRWLERGTRLGEEIGSTFLISSGVHLQGWVRLGTGQWDAALACLERGRRLAEEHELRDRLAAFMLFEAEIYIYRGEYERSQALLSHVLDLAQRHELADSITGSQHLLGYSALMQGRLDAALDYQGERSFTAEPVQSFVQALDLLSSAEWWAMVADAGGLGRLAEDMAVVAAAAGNSLRFFQQHGYRFNLPFASRVNAMLAYQAGDYAAAHGFISRGVSLARTIGMEPEVARGLFWRARIRRRQNPGDGRIRGDLRAAAALFRRLRARPELDQALTLLRAARGGPAD